MSRCKFTQFTRLSKAMGHIGTENAKSEILAISPSIARLNWENSYEVDDSGVSYATRESIVITMADGRKHSNLPDYNDMLCGDLNWWMESANFDDSLLFRGDVNDGGGVDVDLILVGKDWFGFDGGEKQLTALFFAIGDLIELAVASDQSTVEVDLAPTEPGDPIAYQAILAAMAKLDEPVESTETA